MPHVLYLEHCNPQRNRYRFYRLAIERNLFGEWSLCREWGRIGQGGQMRYDLYETREGAERALRRTLQAKQRRGYETRFRLSHKAAI